MGNSEYLCSPKFGKDLAGEIERNYAIVVFVDNDKHAITIIKSAGKMAKNSTRSSW